MQQTDVQSSEMVQMQSAGYDFGGDKGTAVTNYIVDLFANPRIS